VSLDSDQDHKFIELNRTFHELSEHAGKSDDVDLSQIFHVKSSLTWDDILKNHRTVILSEAGSGKTQEIRHIAERLRDEGKAAFFLRLELIPDDFDIAFEVGTQDDFKAWLASGETGRLLLDSVDEARLRSPLDFEKAVRRLGRLIEAAKGRTHIIITGRTHAWRPKTDFDLCERHIGFPPELRMAAPEDIEPELDPTDEFDEEVETTDRSEPASAKFKIIALDDLSREQVKFFATVRGVDAVVAFMKEIERVDAWVSTTRPQDLEDLIALWKQTGQIGNRLQIMQNSIERRLTERDQTRADAKPMSSDRVREGAMLIAAAATLAQTQVIRVPDGANNSTALLPKSVLTGWRDDEIAALLSRPIFDDAIYGTVRFHHRSAREYLTAIWLKELLERPASRRAIEDLLFKNMYGMDVVVPTMRPVLPWLAIFDDRIRERLRGIAPEVIFEGGDPSSLPLPTRREILESVCAKIAQERIVHSATEYAAVQRFAQQDIADDIRRLMKQYASNDAVTGFLVRMIWLGRLKSLSADAKSVALSATASRYTRISAFRAVREIGTSKDQEDIQQSFLKESPRLSREWIGELMTDLAPTTHSTRWALDAIAKCDDKERSRIDRLEDALTAFSDSLDLSDLPELLPGIGLLLDESPFIERGYCEVSKRNSWMIKAAAHAAERLIAAKRPEAMNRDCLEVLRKFRVAREWGDDFRDIKVGFAKLVPDWQELNDASFWHDVAETRKVVSRKKDERLTDYWQAYVFGAFWKFTASDFDRACEWVQNRPEQDDRLVALTIAFAIDNEHGKPKGWRDQLKSICASDPELNAKLTQLLSSPPQVAQYRRDERRRKQREVARAKKKEDQFEKDKQFVQAHIDEMRDPKFPNPEALSRLHWYLHQQVHENRSGSSKWTDGRWRELIPMFGGDVAEAYRDGAIDYWRRYTPVLRSEGGEANKTSAKVIFGLSGLEIESKERPASLQSLSTEEVERATRYALHELNGFPAWFPKFYDTHRTVAKRVLLGEIEHELATGVPDQDSHYVLSDVSWSGEWAWNDIAPSLFAIVEKAEPNNASQLHQILKIVQGSDVPDEEIARLAAVRVAQADDRHSGDWFAVWVGVDPETAMPALAKHLEGLTHARNRTEFAMRFVSKLWGGRRSETFGARGRFRTPEHLKELYILVHKYIRVEDDIDRAGGGVYSPELRDDAQDGRNRILQELNKFPGKEAFLALENLAAAHRQHPSYAYLENLCRNRAEQDADLRPWSPNDVKEFHERLDRTPSNHGELADLAVLRLLDLKDDLEEGDDSVAAVVRNIDEETTLRNYIGHDLRQKAFARYSIPQEEQLADDKKPDLRFHGVGFDAPVPVELKITDNWTGPKLFERLENQLAGDYLRDIRSGRGIFVLVYRGFEKSGWQISSSNRPVDFNGLLTALREHWKTIASKYPGVEDITIVGIDLTKRFK
jgi:hypothetical protein